MDETPQQDGSTGGETPSGAPQNRPVPMAAIAGAIILVGLVAFALYRRGLTSPTPGVDPAASPAPAAGAIPDPAAAAPSGAAPSAGGPIIHPEMDALLIAPICPHTLTMRPLVVPAVAQVEIVLQTGDSEVYLTLDGQVGYPLRPRDRVRVKRGTHPVLMVRTRRRNYFDVLRRKLRWGER